jgi:hypothetical protein
MIRDSIEQMREALMRLPVLGRAELRAEWLGLYGTEAPARLGRELLMAAIAYGLQADRLGGLRPELRRRLRTITEAAQSGGEVVLTTPRRLKPGTRLIREWQGRTHEVLVGDGGFLWQRTQYRSLSQIARAITGTRWSGPVFFGLKPRTGSTGRGRDQLDVAV